ncbi:tRNA(His) guanylyltransferase Thg1 family protein [Agarivorans litoreus]|uniref:tRNA(His) guanylyltransferase Thg1 family protein n=1 Tax=Agarivorans litoreus TaxID=1510455 RepID=UPI001C7CE49E|nr:tRNA(His) guanylyltransferase Thg1 family protein [Agarivorans litoreus]
MESLTEHLSQEFRFKDIEETSERFSKYDDHIYFVVRLDGIGLSKKYLRDTMRHKAFEGIMWDAMENTFDVIRRKCPHDSQNIVLGACVCSDEVSIVLSRVPNYFENRVIKSVTTIASTFTSFFTGKGMIKKKSPHISGAFDGRPLMLREQDDIVDYFSYRYAVNMRNSLTKLLRLSGVDSDEIYQDNNFNSLDYLISKVTELGLQDETAALFETPIFFVSAEQKLENYRFNSIEEMRELFGSKLKIQESWLAQFA